METWRRKPDSNPLASPRILTQLGSVRVAQQQFAEAEPLLRESLALAQRYWPTGEYRYLVMSHLGASLTGQENHAEAETLLRSSCEGLTRGRAILPPFLYPERRLAESLERLVQLYDAWGKPAQATEWKQKLAAFQQASKAADKKGAQQ